MARAGLKRISSWQEAGSRKIELELLIAKDKGLLAGEKE